MAAVSSGWASAHTREVVERVEELRRRLDQDDTPLDREGDTVSVFDFSGRASKPIHWMRLLAELVHGLRPSTLFELGSGVGLSGVCLGLAMPPDARLDTIEGNSDTVKVARRTIASAGLSQRATVHAGRFEDVLGDVLADAAPVDFLFIDGHHQEDPTQRYFEQALDHLSSGAVIVLDDIHWTDGMTRAWNRIRERPEVAFSVDAGGLGVVGV